MWGICKESIVSGLETLIDQMQEDAIMMAQIAGDQILNLHDALMKFIRDDGNSEAIRSQFALNPGKLARLQNIWRDENTISGTYCVSLGELGQVYSKYSTDVNSEIIATIHDYMPQEWLDEPVCEVKIKVWLNEDGIIDKVTDENNSPFPLNVTDEHGKPVTIMLGFRRICAHCGKTLSRAVGCADEIVVALAGSPRAGKTSCLVAMISSLMEQSNLGIRLVPQSHDETWTSMEKEIESYQNCFKVTKTPDIQKEVPVYSMLIEIDDQKKGYNKTQKVLTVVDMPGEFWQVGEGLTEQFFVQYSGLYENIDCIWFVTSKATVRLSQAQNEIPDFIRRELSDQTSENADEIFKGNPANLEKNFRTLKAHFESKKKTMPPMLVVLSKPDFSVSDTDRESTGAYKLFPPENVVSQNAEDLSAVIQHVTEKDRTVRWQGVNEKALYDHARGVQDYIQDCNVQFLQAIENNCEDRFYTTVSAYGQPASEKGIGNPRKPTPYHELYPLLWTLAITGSTRVYHKCNWLTKGLFGNIKDTQETWEGVLFPYSKTKEIIANAKDKKKAEDYRSVYEDLKKNMFMREKKYSITTIEHKRG